MCQYFYSILIMDSAFSAPITRTRKVLYIVRELVRSATLVAANERNLKNYSGLSVQRTILCPVIIHIREIYVRTCTITTTIRMTGNKSRRQWIKSCSFAAILPSSFRGYQHRRTSPPASRSKTASGSPVGDDDNTKIAIIAT